jgi:hypothetical protein
VLSVVFRLDAEFVGGVGCCTNISAKALVAAAGEKVRSICAVSLHFFPRTNLDCKLAAMGQQKKEAVRKERQGKTGDGMGNVKVKGENFYRYAPSCTLRRGRRRN